MAKRNEKGCLFLLVALAAVTVGAAQGTSLVGALIGGLLGGGGQPNPPAPAPYTTEIQEAVRDIVKKNRDVAPGLIRLVFHDCWVKGCDGSVMLDSTPTNNKGQTEKNSDKNGHLRGLNLIQEIRDAIAKIPGRDNKPVSCADAIVFAAREATFVLSGDAKIAYDINGPGRRDSVVSSKKDADELLPGATDSFNQLLKIFEAKTGFGVKDMVALSATHSIGVCHKPSFDDRMLPPVLKRGEIDEDYQQAIIEEFNKNQNADFKNNLRDMGPDALTRSKFQNDGVPANVDMDAKDVLNNSYFIFMQKNMVRFTSDWALRNDTRPGNPAATWLDAFTKSTVWEAAFKEAMTKMSNTIESKGPFESGSRKVCNLVNS